MKKLIRETLHQHLHQQFRVERVRKEDFDALFLSMKAEFGGAVPDEYIQNKVVLQIDPQISFKVVLDDEIVGYLLFRKTRLRDLLQGQHDIKVLNPDLSIPQNQTGIEGMAFYLQAAYRGLGLDKKLLRVASQNLHCNSFIFAEVMHSLSTHNYWKRFGFVPYLQYDDLVLYVKLC